MSDRGDPAFLQDIAEAISTIVLYIKDFDYFSFLKDGKTRDAVVRNLEIISEAAKNIRDSFKKMKSHMCQVLNWQVEPRQDI